MATTSVKGQASVFTDNRSLLALSQAITKKQYLRSVLDAFVLGSMVLDPDHYWVLLEDNARCEWEDKSLGGVMSVVSVAEYNYADDGLPILRRLVRRQNTPAPGKEVEATFVFELREAQLPESEFTLSAFGLPEIADAPQRSSWYFWAGAAGLTCVVLAALLWRRAARSGATR
jgi:hypothetical protein